jgi:hypothetical protein
LREMGDFAAALEALQKGHALGSRGAGWPYPSAAWVKQCEELLALEQQLPAVLGGEKSSAAEQLALAELCRHYRQQYGIAARLYDGAFAADPKLTGDRAQGHRYNAACAASLAAAGKGKDADKLDDEDRAKLRGQALDWLLAELTACTKTLEPDRLSAILPHWQTDANFAGVRDEKELARLPKEEQAAWRQFWAEVAALRDRSGKQPGEEKSKP